MTAQSVCIGVRMRSDCTVSNEQTSKMTSEKSQIKFAKSERTGELIGFVSRHSKTRQLKGVRENYALGKQICVLAEDLKGTIEPNVLYSVELKPMHKARGMW